MSVKTYARRASIALGGAALLVGAALSTAGTASAATPTVELCSNGNYASLIQWKSHDSSEHYSESVIVPEATCRKFTVGSGPTYFDVVGLYNTNSNIFYVGSSGVGNLLVRALGTTTHPFMSTKAV